MSLVETKNPPPELDKIGGETPPEQGNLPQVESEIILIRISPQDQVFSHRNWKPAGGLLAGLEEVVQLHQQAEVAFHAVSALHEGLLTIHFAGADRHPHFRWSVDGELGGL